MTQQQSGFYYVVLELPNLLLKKRGKGIQWIETLKKCGVGGQMRVSSQMNNTGNVRCLSGITAAWLDGHTEVARTREEWPEWRGGRRPKKDATRWGKWRWAADIKRGVRLWTACGCGWTVNEWCKGRWAERDSYVFLKVSSPQYVCLKSLS